MRRHVESLSTRDSRLVLKTLPGKLDIKSHSPSILYLVFIEFEWIDTDHPLEEFHLKYSAFYYHAANQFNKCIVHEYKFGDIAVM